MRKPLVTAIVVVALLAGCGGDDNSSGSGRRGSDTLDVFAAASLTDVFSALGAAFEAGHPGIDVTFNFAASSELAVQIGEGAPADVFASADELNMQKVVDAGQTDSAPVVFARNRLAIAVEEANPQRISSLADLANPDLTVVLCAEQVPCGRYADEVLTSADADVAPASRGNSVRAILTLVELGEADAAIVYASDIVTAKNVEGVAIPDAENVIATLPIVGIAGGNNALAREWIDYVISAEATAVLTDEFGFLAP